MHRTFTARAALVAGAVVLLAGCGSSDKKSTDTAKAGGIKLVKAGQLTTCTHLPYPPFQSIEGGKVVGFDVDLMDLVAKDLGVTQKIVDTPFENIKTGAALNAGQCDVAAAGMTITDERKKNIDFSVPYFDATQALLAKKGSGITSMDTAKDKKVGSQASTTGEDYVKAHGADPVSFETSDAELNGLRSGQVDVIVQDLPVVNGWLKDAANSGFEIVANLDTGEQYGFAVKKDSNDELLAKIDAAITKAKGDGTYESLYTKWIGEKPGS
ncbi:transporter substrate-binding domain-containing protein [Jatrophihabitans sp.]|jgi:polar amino acid transport system substrate-binding protein|uniref:transporter substrate-binding domain-containing protein n=1 Tax=Jatrophihabitans sp. TaxID=1932789 RepID=UPI002EE9D26E